MLSLTEPLRTVVVDGTEVRVSLSSTPSRTVGVMLAGVVVVGEAVIGGMVDVTDDIAVRAVLTGVLVV